ncbi:MAG: hypothetical protein ACK4N5_26750, partial [Myxococcales bacterium]
ISVSRGAEQDIAEILNYALVNAIDGSRRYKTITYKDVESLLGHEERKAQVKVKVAQKTGGEVCTDDSVSCLAEVGGALGARLVISGALSRLGSSYVFSAQVLDQGRAEVVQRFQGTASGEKEEQLLELARRAAQELFREL